MATTFEIYKKEKKFRDDRDIETKMARILSNNLFAALLLAAIVIVKSLPTSVLVDGKQEQAEQLPSSLNKGKNNNSLSHHLIYLLRIFF